MSFDINLRQQLDHSQTTTRVAHQSGAPRVEEVGNQVVSANHSEYTNTCSFMSR